MDKIREILGFIAKKELSRTGSRVPPAEYYEGRDDGEILLSRQILKMLDEETNAN